jgi:hypothetical protein
MERQEIMTLSVQDPAHTPGFSTESVSGLF